MIIQKFKKNPLALGGNFNFKSRFKRRPFWYGLMVVLGVGFVLAALIYQSSLSPSDMKPDTYVRIYKGGTVSNAADWLVEKRVIRSPLLFKIFYKLPGIKDQVVAGDYVFRARKPFWVIWYRLYHGDFATEKYKIPIPEGTTVNGIMGILSRQMPNFNRAEFARLASTSEGYLFPTTYYFSPLATSSLEIFTVMRDTFEQQTKTLKFRAQGTKRSWHEIITMASLLEHEASNPKDRRLISGILWRRVDEGMRLQVDAVFPFIIGRNTFEVTKADLRHASPYNTYVVKGLPPGPIDNPSLDSIEAAIYPTPSLYLYYLADYNGVTHYAETFPEHIKNRQLYLDNR